MSIAAIMFMRARPPGKEPTKVFAKAISLWAMPPLFINSPERMKKGMANKAKLSSPVAIRWETVVKAGNAGMLTSMVKSEEMAILQATGVPIAKRHKKLMTKTSTGILSNIISFLKDRKLYNK
jgi:hypothetical protein